MDHSDITKRNFANGVYTKMLFSTLFLDLFSARRELAAQPENDSVPSRRDPTSDRAEKICSKTVERKHRRESKDPGHSDC